MTGLFFCLASSEGAGLLFCSDAIQPHTSVYSAFCAINAIIPPTPQNHAQGFTGAFPVIVPAKPPTIPDRHKRPLYHLRHAGAHTRARAPSTDTRTTATPGRCTGQRSRPIIIRYIMAQRCACYGSMPDSAAYSRPCQPDGLQSGTGQQSGRTGSAWHTPPGGAVQRQGGVAGGAEPLAALAVSLFGLSPDS